MTYQKKKINMDTKTYILLISLQPQYYFNGI